jgi:hypothetical protein
VSSRRLADIKGFKYLEEEEILVGKEALGGSLKRGERQMWVLRDGEDLEKKGEGKEIQSEWHRSRAKLIDQTILSMRCVSENTRR